MSKPSIQYLNYWWDPESEINPNSATEDYFKVIYDDQSRYVIVERYNARHELISHTKFSWHNNTLVKVEAYGADGELKRYSLYRYDEKGKLLGTDDYSADGKFLMYSPFKGP